MSSEVTPDLVACPDTAVTYPPPLLIPPSSRPTTPPLGTAHMGKEKDKSRIDIILDSPYVTLRGTTETTVEPAVLSGHVSLYLVEDTDLRQVSLHFRGQAKIPLPTTESLLNNSSQTYIFCSHDWSFLESSCTSSNPSFPTTTSHSHGKRPGSHIRTLKAGRHIFPFTFTLTGNLPSTLTTQPLNFSSSAFPVSTRASVSYKLRAIASRPGLSLGPGPLHNVHIMPTMLHNLTCKIPVYVLRSLTPEALEYQQSVEVENTWPEKLMYAIMLPHKAWAAGDTLVAVLKLSPLAKGVWVESVLTTLLETTELHVQHHHLKNALHLHHPYKMVHRETRIVRCVKHDIVHGKAVRVGLLSSAIGKTSRGSDAPSGSVSRAGSRPGSSMGHSSGGLGHFTDRGSGDSPTVDPLAEGDESVITSEELENHDVLTYITFPIPHVASGPYSSATTTPTGASSASSTTIMPPTTTSHTRPHSPPIGFSTSSSIPPASMFSYNASTPPSPSTPLSCATVTPTHNLPPLLISHRIRWTFSIHNRDGHTSELRCSLPIHILDGRVLSEAREASVLTRRLTLVGEGVWRGEEGEEVLGLGAGRESTDTAGDIYVDRELPTYTAHVRDRVANMHFPETSTMRVPWAGIAASGDGVLMDHVNTDEMTIGGLSSQARSHSSSHLYSRSSRPASGQNTPGHHHIVSLSEGRDHHHLPHAPSPSSSASHASPLDWVNSELLSLSLRSFGRRESQHATTNGMDSPQMQSEMHSRAGSPDRGSNIPGAGSTDDHQGSGSGHHVKNLSNLFKATMKPFMALSHHGRHGHGGHGLIRLSKSSSHDDHIHPPSSNPSSGRPSPTRTTSAPLPAPLPTTSLSTPSSLVSLSTSSSPFPSAVPIPSATIHRSMSDVPDYSVASKGFMGGVPPLSSLMGLPSYEEAAGEGRRPRQREQNEIEQVLREDRRIVGSNSSPATAVRSSMNATAGPSSGEMTATPTTKARRETVSDTDLVGRFWRPSRIGILQQLDNRHCIDESLSGSEEEEEEGIQMKTTARGRSQA